MNLGYDFPSATSSSRMQPRAAGSTGKNCIPIVKSGGHFTQPAVLFFGTSYAIFHQD